MPGAERRPNESPTAPENVVTDMSSAKDSERFMLVPTSTVLILYMSIRSPG